VIARLTLMAAALACLTSACMPTGLSSSQPIAWQVRGAELVGDVDGDGRAEQVAVEEAGEQSCRLRLRARGTRKTLVTPIRLDWCADKPPQHHPSVTGLAAIDRRPGLEIVVELGCGAHTCSATIFGVTDGSLREWQADHKPLAYGGSVGTGAHTVDCAEEEGVVVQSGYDFRRSSMHRTWYRVRDGRLERITSAGSRRQRPLPRWFNQGRPFASCTVVPAAD
jgi:hypothetical protein